MTENKLRQGIEEERARSGESGRKEGGSVEGKRGGWGGEGEGMKERRKSRERRKRSGGNRVAKKRGRREHGKQHFYSLRRKGVSLIAENWRTPQRNMRYIK